MKVYILTECSGQYEDYYEGVVGVYSTYKKAENEKNTKIKGHKDFKEKYTKQTRAMDDLYIEWDETLKDKYLGEGLSLQQANKKLEELLDTLEEIDYYGDEDYWYNINGFKLE